MREVQNSPSIDMTRARPTISFVLSIVGLVACTATPVKSTLPGGPTRAQLAELWVQPDRGRDLFNGVGGARLAPDPSAVYRVIDMKRTGFSRGYTLKGPGGSEWSAKFPPEAGPEVTASRILWGIGYHQPPIYYVATWNAADPPV